MPRLVDRATGTLGSLTPKAIGLAAVTGFAAAGVASVVAENIRTLGDREEPLPDRAKRVAQNSIGAVLAGPSALSQRGRELVGRGGPTDGEAADVAPARPAPATGPTGGTPAERPTRSKAEEARVRDGDGPTSEPASASGEATATAPRPTQSGGTATEPVPPRGIDTSSAASVTAPADPASRTVDASTQATPEEAAGDKSRARKAPAQPEATSDHTDVPAGTDPNLVRDLERMTVKQLRDRASQEGVPGRSGMSKAELVAALARRDGDASG